MKVAYSCVLLAGFAAARAAPLANPTVPQPASVPLHETVFGIAIDDPYRWMEDSAKLPAMRDWVTASSAATVADLAHLPERAAFANALEQASRAGVRFSDVTSAGGKLFYRRQDPADRVPKLMVREAGHERLLLDPAAGQAGVAAIGNYSVSPDGGTVAVQVAQGGGEAGDIRFLDVATGAAEGAHLGPVWGEFAVSWLAPGKIAYTRMAAPGPGLDPTQGMKAAVLAPGAAGPGQFVLGPDVSGSPPIQPVEFPLILKSPLSDYAIGLGAGARSDARVFLAKAADVASGHAGWRIVAEYADEVTNTDLLGDTLFVLTTKGSPNGRVDRRSASAVSASPRTILPESGLVLEDMAAAKDGLYVVGQRDGIAHLLFLPGGDGPAREVALPIEGDLSGLRADLDGGSVVFGLNGWTSNVTFYRAAAGQVAPLGLASDSWPGAAGITALRDEAVSTDGTRVPMVTLLPPGGKRAPLPVILEGYGGYGINNVAPWYNPPYLAWVAHGGGFAFCGTRGGNEHGRSWHEGGQAANKPKAQADFIACAERLEAAGYTTKAMLVATGTSAGGGLVPPAVLRRPDLFGALISRVGIVNPTRLAAAENGPNQYVEFGDPRTADGFAALREEDAYQMLGAARDMPDTLVTIGLNDRRVAPWMGAKFAARAREKFGARRLVLIRADAEAGHGIGSARDRQIAEWADSFAFAWAATHP